MNSDITRALLENAIKIEELKRDRAKDEELRERFSQRIERFKETLVDLFPEPDTVDLSSDWDGILHFLEEAAGRTFTGKPLPVGVVRGKTRK